MSKMGLNKKSKKMPAPVRNTVFPSRLGDQASPNTGEKFVHCLRVGPKPSAPRIGEQRRLGQVVIEVTVDAPSEAVVKIQS